MAAGMGSTAQLANGGRGGSRRQAAQPTAPAQQPLSPPAPLKGGFKSMKTKWLAAYEAEQREAARRAAEAVVATAAAETDAASPAPADAPASAADLLVSKHSQQQQHHHQHQHQGPSRAELCGTRQPEQPLAERPAPDCSLATGSFVAEVKVKPLASPGAAALPSPPPASAAEARGRGKVGKPEGPPQPAAALQAQLGGRNRTAQKHENGRAGDGGARGRGDQRDTEPQLQDLAAAAADGGGKRSRNADRAAGGN